MVKGQKITFSLTGDSIESMESLSLTPKIFSVNDKEITGLEIGTGKLQLSARKEGHRETKKEFDVIVNDLPEFDISISPNPTNVTKELTAEFNIDGEYDRKEIKSLTPEIFTITDNIITGIETGTGKLEVKAFKENFKDKIKIFDIQVLEPTKYLEINMTSGNTVMEDTLSDFEITFTGNYETITDIKTLNPEIFTIENNKIKGIKPGIGKLRVTVRRKGYKLTTKDFDITIIDMPSIEFNMVPNPIEVTHELTKDFNIIGEYDNIEIESSNNEVFTINNKTITGIKIGTAKLRLTATKQLHKQTVKEFTVNVLEPTEYLEINMNSTNSVMENTTSSNLEFIGNYETITEPVSLNPELFTIENNQLKGIQPGDGKLKVKAIRKGYKETVKEFDITVTEMPNVEFNIDPETIEVIHELTKEFNITGSYDNIEITSLDTNIFTVIDRVITGVNIGSAKLQIIATKNLHKPTTKEFTVNIIEPTEYIDIEMSSPASVMETASLALSFAGSYDILTSESLNPEIFTVENNQLRGVIPGTGKLRIVARKKGYKETIKDFDITVTVMPTLEFNVTAPGTVVRGRAVGLSVTGGVTPTTVSLNPDILRVDNSTTIAGIKNGTGKIRVTGSKPGFKNADREVSITVVDPPQTPDFSIRVGNGNIFRRAFHVTGDFNHMSVSANNGNISIAVNGKNFTAQQRKYTGRPTVTFTITATKNGCTPRTKTITHKF